MNIGIIGGTGWLGATIIKQLLKNNFIPPQNLWVSNRSGKKEINITQAHFTTDNQELVDQCNVIILSIRPADFLNLRIRIKDQLLISVMAGIPLSKIQQVTSAKYVIRCMPNPAAEFGLSYTPWIASLNVSTNHKKYLRQLFANLGESDELENEEDIDFFTALTGSGEGLINYFALTMLESAVNYGLNPRVAEKAICQLFKGIGYLMVNSERSIEETVANLIHYAGTTAAGINALKKADLSTVVDAGLQAAYIKAKKLSD